MKISFADRRPEGDYALVAARVAARTARRLQASARRRRASRRRSTASASKARRAAPPSISPTTGDHRRVLVVGVGKDSKSRRGGREARRNRGRAAADLGREDGGHRRLRRSGSMPTARPGSALARRFAAGATTAIARGSRTSDKPTPDRDRHRRRAPSGAAEALRRALGAGRRRGRADPRAGHRAGQHHLPRKLRRAGPRVARGQRARDQGARPRGDGKARHGRAARRRRRARCARRGC